MSQNENENLNDDNEEMVLLSDLEFEGEEMTLLSDLESPGWWE